MAFLRMRKLGHKGVDQGPIRVTCEASKTKRFASKRAYREYLLRVANDDLAGDGRSEHTSRLGRHHGGLDHSGRPGKVRYSNRWEWKPTD